MPTQTQYEIVKQQVRSFAELGYKTTFDIQPMANNAAAPKIVIDNWLKSWRFSDPDWDVVSRQLAQLYVKIKGNHQR